MARYTPLAGDGARPSISHSRHTSISSYHTSASARNTETTAEMNAAFASDDEDDDDDQDNERGVQRGLLDPGDRRKGDSHAIREAEQFAIGGEDNDEEDIPRGQPFDDPLRDDMETARVGGRAHSDNTQRERMPGSYDFQRDFFLAPARPASPPPFFAHWSANPAPENSNGIIPTATPAYPRGHPAHRSTRLELLGSLLPSFFHPRTRTDGPSLGGGHTGVFANLSARPELPQSAPREGTAEGPEWVPEFEGKDVPPTYESALRDAVPQYWETTVVLPSHGGPFGAMTSSMTGDEILIDGMPVGYMFAFLGNMIVSLTFQLVGFLLTYVLHTTHAAKHGSRAGLGITLIQYGLYLRNRAEEMIETGRFPVDSDDAGHDPNYDPFEDLDTLREYWSPGFRTPPHTSYDGTIQIPSFKSPEAAKEWELANANLNMTMAEILQMPSAKEVGQANEWLSFMLMAAGWFIFLTSVGSYWRVKRFENGLRSSQNTDDDPTDELGNPPDPQASNPRNIAFYRSHATQTLRTFRRIRDNATQLLPPLDFLNRSRFNASDENTGRRGRNTEPEDEADGANGFLLFSRGREHDPDMDEGVDIPSAARAVDDSHGLTTEEWSRSRTRIG